MASCSSPAYACWCAATGSRPTRRTGWTRDPSATRARRRRTRRTAGWRPATIRWTPPSTDRSGRTPFCAESLRHRAGGSIEPAVASHEVERPVDAERQLHHANARKPGGERRPGRAVIGRREDVPLSRAVAVGTIELARTRIEHER